MSKKNQGSKDSQESTERGIATIGASVPDALEALKRELKELKAISETQYKTGGSGMVMGFTKSIQEETSIETLVKMVSAVRGRETHYNKAVDELAGKIGGLSAPVFKENGQSPESIVDDIALRIQVLSVAERRKELEDLLKEAEQFLTKEDQFKMFQAKLASRLGLQKD
jgi:hypothetical protein